MKTLAVTLTMIVSLSALNAQMQQAVEQIAHDYGLSGLSVVAVCDAKIAGEWYTGLRDIDRSLPVNADTRYRIASISKLVLTTAMLTLHDSGRLDLDADVSDYLGFTLRNPSYPDRPVTPRMLLLHTGSIHEGNGYDSFLMATYNNVGNPPSFSELLVPGGEYYTADMWLNKPPGEYYSYCNANYGLAGTIIERITGERFEEFMQKTLFAPLGITASYIVEGLPEVENLAVIYQQRDGRWIPQTDDFKGVLSAPRDFTGYVTGFNGAVFSPQGGLRISAAGLARVMILHMNRGKYNGKRILSKKAVRLMHEPGWRWNGSNADVEDVRQGDRGLGTQILPDPAPGSLLPPGSRMIGHSGSAYGLISDFYFDPDGKYGFIFITNGIAGGPKKGESGLFYSFEEALIRALRDNNLLPCRERKR